MFRKSKINIKQYLYSQMSKRGRPSTKEGNEGTKGRKKMKEEVDYSNQEDVANQLRIDCIQAIHVTKSGHPSSSSSIADIMAVLFFNTNGMKFYPKNHSHFLNDRLVLSKGHAAPILYAAFFRAGIVEEKELMSLRLKGALLEGHPVPKIPFVDVATGSLGQGLSVAAGMAYSSKYFDKINNHVYCICGDGEVAEGSIWQAAAFSSHYKLNNLVVFVDVNALGQSQQTMYGKHANVYADRFKAFGFNTMTIDGHSIKDIVNSLVKSKDSKDKPTAIICKTLKGKNFVSTVEGQLNWHGKDLGAHHEQSIQLLKGMIKNPEMKFEVFIPEGEEPNTEKGTVVVKPDYNKETSKISTRKAYGSGLLKARQSNQNVVGLDGDTKNSTFAITLMDKHPDSFVECFIAEQNLVGVATGLSCRNKIPFCSTFATFFMRAADQIRIAGISGSKIKLAGSHSGCSIGEDGPSQMALEDIAFFRTIPKGVVLIPSDGVSAEKAVEVAANYNDGPVFIRTARPDVSILYDNEEEFALGKFFVLKKSEEDKLVIITVGVTVHESIKAVNKLEEQGIKVRIIDLFSVKPLDAEGLKKNIEECNGVVLAIEEHYPQGGVHDAICSSVAGSIKKIEHLCVRTIPGSAKPQEQLEIQGLDHESIYNKVKEIIA